MSMWPQAVELKKSILVTLKQKRVDLSSNPVRENNIGGLSDKLALTRSHMNDVRDILYDVQSLMISLRREYHSAMDLYEDSLAVEIKAMASQSEEVVKKLPRSEKERERFFRQNFTNVHKSYLEAERRVEEWEQFQKMVETIYWSLRDTNHDIQTQIAIIKQQYFSGEVRLNKTAVDAFGILSDDARRFMAGSPEKPDADPTTANQVEL